MKFARNQFYHKPASEKRLLLAGFLRKVSISRWNYDRIKANLTMLRKDYHDRSN